MRYFFLESIHILRIYLLFFTQNLEQYLKRRRASAVLLGGREATKAMREDTNLSLHQGRRSSVFSLEPHWEPKTAEVSIEKGGIRQKTQPNLLDSRYVSTFW